jgi:nucleoside-diphosphate-sugar epimerase
MDKSRIIITGAGGFIGSALVSFFIKQGFEVIALDRSVPPNLLNGIKFSKFILNADVDETVFANASICIHCAFEKYQKKNNSYRNNIEGSRKIIELCRRHNVQKLVFLSSMSASDKALSIYGKSKFEIEKLLDPLQDLIFRPGLVLGNGGLFSEIANFIKKNKFIPLIDGGNQIMQVISVDDLIQFINYGITHQISGIYAIACPESLQMKNLYRKIARRINKHIYFFYVPYFLAWLFFQAIDLLNLSLGVTRENLLGLRVSTLHDVSSLQKTFPIQVSNIDQIISQIKL